MTLDKSRLVAELPLDAIIFIKKWPDFLKQVYQGIEMFDVDGVQVEFEKMKSLMTLLISTVEKEKWNLSKFYILKMKNNTSNKRDKKAAINFSNGFGYEFREKVV